MASINDKTSRPSETINIVPAPGQCWILNKAPIVTPATPSKKIANMCFTFIIFDLKVIF